MTIPAPALTTIESVATDLPCSTAIMTANRVYVIRPTAGTCQVRVELSNDDTYTFSAEFQVFTCCGLSHVIDASAPQLVDARSGPG